MAEYNPSKIIKDGNTYNFRDDTKIPLAGTNALAGSIVPDTDNAYALGSSTKQFNGVYTSNVVNHNTTSESAFGNVTDGANMSLCPKEYNAGLFRIQAFDGTTRQSFNGYANGTLTWGSKNVAMQEDVIPRSGGAVMTGTVIGRVNNAAGLDICGGISFENGGFIALRGKNANVPGQEGAVVIGTNNGLNNCNMLLKPDGTATWGNKEIETIEEQGTGYIRYTNGIQICFSSLNALNSEIEKQITFPKPFALSPAVLVCGQTSYLYLNGWNATHFLARVDGGATIYFSWIAIGTWK